MTDDKLDINSIRVYPESIYELPIQELKTEYASFMWLAEKTEEAVRWYTKRLYKLREKIPVEGDTREQVLADYEDGKITMTERKQRMRKITEIERNHIRAEAYILIGQRAADHYKAVAVEIGERIQMLKDKAEYEPTQNATKKSLLARKRRRNHKIYRPRRKPRWYAEQPWRNEMPTACSKKALRPRPKVSNLRKKWSKISYSEYMLKKSVEKTNPLSTFDREALKRIAYSRGYYTPQTLYGAIAEVMGTTISGVSKMMSSGRISPDNMRLISALLELTPAEFCDIFLKGYFAETVDGKWTAVMPEGYGTARDFAEKAQQEKENGDNCAGME